MRIQPLPSGMLNARGSVAESHAEETSESEDALHTLAEAEASAGASAGAGAGAAGAGAGAAAASPASAAHQESLSPNDGSAPASRRDTHTSSDAEGHNLSRRASDKPPAAGLSRNQGRGSRLFRRRSSSSRSVRRNSEISTAAAAVRKAYAEALTNGR